MSAAMAPHVDEMSPEEQHFLTLTADFGLDWTSTRADYARRFGVSRYHDWQDVVALPPTTAWSSAPLAFAMYADPATMDLPPEYLWADHVPHPDARRNHAELEGWLTARLGPPTVADTSNCLVRRWRFGVFTVEQHSFPPELQGRVAGGNTLYAKAPHLVHRSTVTLRSAYAWVFPDARLLPVADLARRAGEPGVPAQVVEAHASRPDRRATRRNPTALVAAMGEGAVLVWRDPATGLRGVSTRATSQVFDPREATAVVLTRVQPARGPGGAHLSLRGLAPGASSPLLEGSTPQALDAVAERVASLWDLPLHTEAGLDD